MTSQNILCKIFILEQLVTISVASFIQEHPVIKTIADQLVIGESSEPVQPVPVFLNHGQLTDDNVFEDNENPNYGNVPIGVLGVDFDESFRPPVLAHVYQPVNASGKLKNAFFS